MILSCLPLIHSRLGTFVDILHISTFFSRSDPLSLSGRPSEIGFHHDTYQTISLLETVTLATLPDSTRERKSE